MLTRRSFLDIAVLLAAAPLTDTLCGSFGSELDAGDGKKWNVLFPRGTWHGRNLKSIGGSITLDDKMFEEVIANWAAAGKPKLPIRKTHLHLVKDDPALQESFGDLEDFRITAAGLEALTDWNDDGRALVKSRKFRSWSPEWHPSHEDRRTGEAKGWWLSGTALTNDPFFHTMPPVAATTAPAAGSSTDPNPNQEQHMTKEQLQKMALSLGLKADATVEEVLKAQAEVGVKLAAAETERKALVATTSPEALNALIATALEPMKVEQKKLSDENAKLKAENLAKDVETLIADGKRQGKALEPLRKLIVAAASRSLDEAKELIAGIASTVPLTAAGYDLKTEGMLTAQAASDKLTVIANENAAKGIAAPMEVAMQQHPDLAKAAQPLTQSVSNPNKN